MNTDPEPHYTPIYFRALFPLLVAVVALMAQPSPVSVLAIVVIAAWIWREVRYTPPVE